MADIALLVVEEFENRKRWAKEDGIAALHAALRSATAALAAKAEQQRPSSMPKNPVGVAALDGLFSP